jgi:transcription initiation factor IIF auxiliary subunit
VKIREKLNEVSQLLDAMAQQRTGIARVELKREARPLPGETADNRTWYEVTVTLEGPQETLNHVRYVEYLLHPTFNPNRTWRRNPPHFSLRLKLWGEFTLKAEVHFAQDPAFPLARYLSLRT